MRIVDGTLILETTRCSNCTGGQRPKPVPCPACQGTGNGKRGGKNGCKDCHGFGKAYDWKQPIACPVCHGTDSRPETDTDSLSPQDFASLPMRLIREDRHSTWLEEYLPIGSCWSTIDYGRSWALSDAEVIEAVRQTTVRIQACKVFRDGRLCAHVAIILHRQGYTVTAAFPLP